MLQFSDNFIASVITVKMQEPWIGAQILYKILLPEIIYTVFQNSFYNRSRVVACDHLDKQYLLWNPSITEPNMVPKFPGGMLSEFQESVWDVQIELQRLKNNEISRFTNPFIGIRKKKKNQSRWLKCQPSVVLHNSNWQTAPFKDPCRLI